MKSALDSRVRVALATGGWTAVSVIAASCSGSGSASPAPAVTPSPSASPTSATSSPPCATVVNALPSLVDPQPGATAVPDAVGRLIVRSGPFDGTFSLQAGSATPFPVGTAGPVAAGASPLPSDAPGASGNYEAVPIPALSQGTTYTVTFAGNNPDPMCPHQSSGTLGAFATK